MTVKQLKELLNNFNDTDYVCIADQNTWGSSYAYSVSRVQRTTLTPYHGEDERVVVIRRDDQIGAV